MFLPYDLSVCSKKISSNGYYSVSKQVFIYDNINYLFCIYNGQN